VPFVEHAVDEHAPAEDVAEEATAEDAAPNTQSDDDSTDDNASRPVATGLHPHRSSEGGTEAQGGSGGNE
jgi:hypothetical protein